MLIHAISDFHGYPLERMLTGHSADLLIIAGDFLNFGTPDEWYKFVLDLKKFVPQYNKGVIVTPGNHDFQCVHFPVLCKQEMKDIGVHFLVDEKIWIGDYLLYASPWVSAINGHHAYELPVPTRNSDIEFIERTWARIPETVDILVTHSPPQNILSGPYGCEWLTDRVGEVRPSIHIFGHVHTKFGSHHTPSTSFYNVAICDEKYDLTHPITEITLIKPPRSSRETYS